MANSKIDVNSKLMAETTGAKVLITDRAADKYLNQASKEQANQKKFTEFCGGKNGWNDYTERWH